MWAYSRGNGQYTFNGQNTGLGLGDFLLGRPSAFVQGNKVGVALHTSGTRGFMLRTPGARRTASPSTPACGGSRTLDRSSTIRRWRISATTRFLRGVKSTVFANAPAGFSYYGDPGYDEPVWHEDAVVESRAARRGGMGRDGRRPPRGADAPTDSPTTFLQRKRGGTRPAARRTATASACRIRRAASTIPMPPSAAARSRW